ncbi:hypothetical protein CPC735_015420 [Paecilomyces variotii No. 5]|uniref:Uncharacterized protein n=1 Tax=Byssochlamys spectabilis (strain No. 5 / NBRC 109023) TaxID=1356009 RepID=V5I5X7_BYSSN|nr:hypothetical protein CPC735_015420 [Paecilomyces variotii No. 5]
MTINSLWFKWKSLRLPWRKSFLVGHDLAGNTYWEFRDSLNSGRFRRIVKYSPKTHYGDIKVNPQWHQWLRYVRSEAPTIEEQQQDLIRQMQLKKLAQLADERWASKPSYLDKPQTQQPAPALRTSDATMSDQGRPAPAPEQTGVRNAVEDQAGLQQKGGKTKAAKNPWAKQTGVPGADFEPEAWTPKASQR